MTNEHTYPPAYTPGPHQPWYLNRAWEILDTIKPGVLDLTIRSFLAGQIAGSLETAAKYGAPDETVPKERRLS